VFHPGRADADEVARGAGRAEDRRMLAQPSRL